jgi:hypothetical protein
MAYAEQQKWINVQQKTFTKWYVPPLITFKHQAVAPRGWKMLTHETQDELETRCERFGGEGSGSGLK